MTVEIRRRAALMALVSVAALGVGLAYAWRFTDTESGLALVVAVVLLAVGIGHGLASADALTPLLVADDTGLRVRLGPDWVGLAWEQLERVEVANRGRFTDGQVAVLPRDLGDALDTVSWRGRLGARFNRFAYDAPLVVPFGLTTRASVVDLASSLTRLAAGRAAVVAVGADVVEPKATVEVHPPQPLAVAASAATNGSEAERPSAPVGSNRPFALTRASRASRAEVTMPIRREPTTDGMLALSQPYPEADAETVPLPEIRQLRRTPEGGDPERGNVALIIDATTDLSLRAMRKVRRPAAAKALDDAAEGEVDPPAEAVGGLVIGAEVTAARLALGLSVDDLADRTRIRPTVIEGIEVDDFAPCGGDFYARGHLRMLGRVLGVDPQPLVTSYDEHFAQQPITPRAVFDAELSTGNPTVRGGAAGSSWGTLVAAVLVIGLIWGIAQYVTGRPSEQGQQPPQNSAGLGSPGAGNQAAAAPRDTFVKVMARGGESRVVVFDGTGERVFIGMLADGDSTRVDGRAPLRVRAVDGGVIALRIDGKQLGLMGEPGERVVQRIKAPGPS